MVDISIVICDESNMVSEVDFFILFVGVEFLRFF